MLVVKLIAQEDRWDEMFQGYQMAHYLVILVERKGGMHQLWKKTSWMVGYQGQ